MRSTLLQFLGLVLLVLPLVAIQWNLGGKRNRVPLLNPKQQRRWRLEIYSNHDNADQALVDRIDIPFPIKQVRSARGQLAQTAGANAWALPRLELEIDVEDPFTNDVMTGLFGPNHFVRFVSGNEAVVDAASDARLRIRALPFRH